jgi:hypothetical protein
MVRDEGRVSRAGWRLVAREAVRWEGRADRQLATDWTLVRRAQAQAGQKPESGQLAMTEPDDQAALATS